MKNQLQALYKLYSVSEEKRKVLEKINTEFEKDLIIAKNNLAQSFIVAFEYGGADLMDLIQSNMSFREVWNFVVYFFLFVIYNYITFYFYIINIILFIHNLGIKNYLFNNSSKFSLSLITNFPYLVIRISGGRSLEL